MTSVYAQDVKYKAWVFSKYTDVKSILEGPQEPKAAHAMCSRPLPRQLRVCKDPAAWPKPSNADIHSLAVQEASGSRKYRPRGELPAHHPYKHHDYCTYTNQCVQLQLAASNASASVWSRDVDLILVHR